MKISRIVIPNVVVGDVVDLEKIVESNIDQSTVIIWDIVKGDTDQEDEIVMTTTYGLEIRAIYEERVASALAQEFRKRGVL